MVVFMFFVLYIDQITMDQINGSSTDPTIEPGGGSQDYKDGGYG